MAQLTDNPLTDMTAVEPSEAPVEVSPAEAEETADDDLLARLDAAEDEIGVMMSDMVDPELPDESPVESAPEQEEPDTSSDQEEDREQPEPIDGDEMEKALSALRRDGLPTDVIEKMTNQEVLELGLKRGKVQADTDNAYRELQELKKSEEDTVETEEDSAPETPAEQPPSPVSDAVKPFKELFGDDGATALQGYTEAILAPVMSQVHQLVNVIGAYTAKEARRELADQYPQLSDNEAYAKVEGRMGALLKSGTYSSAHELMADAARLTFADDQRDAAKAYRNKTRQMRTNGQMLSNSKQVAPAAMSDDDKDTMVLNLLEDGSSREDAIRALHG